jgi:amino acid transporter
VIDPLLAGQLVSGAILMGYLVAGLFFWRFWRETQDRLFAILAVSFWILAIQRLLVALSVSVFESEAYLYGIRLLAYVLILYAIIDKNRNDPKVRDRA